MVKDDELYRSFLSGDDEAFEEIVNKYAEKLIYFLYKYTNNIEIAKDLSQDVFVYILSNKNNYKFKCSLKSYLFMIGKCRALNYLKREKRNIEFQEKYIGQDEMICEIEDIVFNNIDEKRIKELIKRLKEEQRQSGIFSRY